MASIRERKNRAGEVYYEIRVCRGRGKSYLVKMWYPPKGWSRKSVERALSAEAAEFERQVKSGEVVSKEERRELDRQADELRKEEARKAAIEAAKIKTLRQYSDEIFMKAKETDLSENGQLSYRMLLDNHILPVLGELPMGEIDSDMLERLLLEKKRNYSHSTCVKIYNLLNGIFRMAKRSKSIPINPMLDVERPKPRADEVPKEANEKRYTAEELAFILKRVEELPIKWRTYIHVMADTGVRRGECNGIQWRDIDFNGGSITIRHNLQYSPRAGIYDKRPKNKSVRMVYVGERSLDLLRQLRTEQAASCVSKWVFTQEGSPDPLHPDTPTRYFKKLEQRFGIQDFHPHKLRHSFASLAITAGADVASVSEILGHADPSTTMRMYVDSNEESKRRASEIRREAVEKLS